jgi:hypothetical protein
MRKLRKFINLLIVWFIVLMVLTVMGLTLDFLIADRFPGSETPFDIEFGLILGFLAVPITIQISKGMGILRNR